VFTPLEYGAVGYSEEDAIARFGEENIEVPTPLIKLLSTSDPLFVLFSFFKIQVYHSFFKPLEWAVAERETNACYAKLVCNKQDSERVVGFHVLGPNAGEITQGFAIAIK